MILQRRREGASAVGYASREAVNRAAAEGEGGEERRRRDDAVRAPREARDTPDPRRIKRLAAIAAASVAVALVSTAYGTWAALSARAAIDTAAADTQPTLVVKKDIRAGEELLASSYEIRMVPRSLRVASALSSDALAEGGSVAGRHALTSLPAGSQITPSAVAGAAGGDRLAAALSSGMQAVTVAVDAESGLAGQLRVSDRVRVVALEGAASGEAYLSTICDSARVMSLDGDQAAGTRGYASVTLEVSPAQADAVRAAQYAGKVNFILASALDDSLANSKPAVAVADDAAEGDTHG